MDTNEAFEQLSELNPAALTADGFNAAYLGYTTNHHHAIVAVYDRAKCIKILTDQGMSQEEAEEYFSFNTDGAYVGENGPLYVEPFTPV